MFTKTGTNTPRARGVTTAGGAAVLFLVTGGAGLRHLESRLREQVGSARLAPGALAAIPQQFGACPAGDCWQGTELELNERQIRRTDTDELLYRSYRATAGEPVTLLVAYGVRPRDLQPHRPEVCYPAAGWSLQEDRRVELAAADGAAQARLQRFVRGGLNTDQVWVLSYYIVDGQRSPDLALLRAKTWRVQPNFRYMSQIQITTRIVGSVEAAAGLAQQFASLSAPAIREVLAAATAQ